MISDVSQLSEPIDNFVKMCKDMAVIRAATAHSTPSTSDCIKVLYSMKGIEEGSSFFCNVLNMFKVTENREIFFAIRTPKERMNWLNKLTNLSHKQGEEKQRAEKMRF
ncbi:unnamed protein product [Fraxinus pennsylvanica]|uniref:PH domain-containing protein n=1 Tax=Fraxinus pennsylvanica TaxID=56036 RepID=A0AAD2DZD7_9LAMI|nr:unnamed protein product [Fraxinus pennsylvanica]